MLRRLQWRLVFMFTVITFLIISAVAIIVCMFNIYQVRAGSREVFVDNVNTVVNKLAKEKLIKDSWLAEMETSHNMVIHIVINQIPLFFSGSYNLPFDIRDKLLEQAGHLAEKEEISDEELWRSSIGAVKTPDNSSYVSGVNRITSVNQTKVITILQYFPHEKPQIEKIMKTGILAEALSLLLLFAASYLLVKRAMVPVERNQIKQKEFIAAASHELRSPLAVIQTDVEALDGKTAQSQRFIAQILNECRRLSRLIDDMLVLASSDANAWKLETEELDMEVFLIELYETYTNLCKAKNQKIAVDFRDLNIPAVQADRQRLWQIFCILLDNSLHYAPADSEIKITEFTDISRKKLCLEIKDHGAGIPDMEKEQVFERFYRSDLSRNDKNHYGLGLSIAKELVTRHGGKIYIKDTDGGGCTYIIELPVWNK